MPEVVMPRLSDSMEEGTVLKWLKAEGDAVRRGDELVEIETDKATMTYEADQDGVLEIVAQEGDTLPIGAGDRADRRRRYAVPRADAADERRTRGRSVEAKDGAPDAKAERRRRTARRTPRRRRHAQARTAPATAGTARKTVTPPPGGQGGPRRRRRRARHSRQGLPGGAPDRA